MLWLLNRYYVKQLFLAMLSLTLPPLIHARLNLPQLRNCLFVVPYNSSPTLLVLEEAA